MAGLAHQVQVEQVAGLVLAVKVDSVELVVGQEQAV